MSKKALVLGVTGQDGSILSEQLLEDDYTVVGVARRSSVNTTERLSNVIDNDSFILVEGDITDSGSINNIFREHMPDLCFCTAAQSHVATSFEQPSYTFQVNTVGVLNVLEAIRIISPQTKMLQFSTSEMFGSNYNTKVINNKTVHCQDENTVFAPNSPYAVSKVAAHHLVDLYQRSYNLFVCCIIGFNHESARRGEKFVTKKITQYVAKLYSYLKTGSQGAPPILYLGNIDAKRDWGYAPDTCRACLLILQQNEPKHYVVSTGETHSVRDFLDEAFAYIGVYDWTPYVMTDFGLYRPHDVDYLLGDSTKIRELGWAPSITFKELVSIMVSYDISKLDVSYFRIGELYV